MLPGLEVEVGHSRERGEGGGTDRRVLEELEVSHEKNRITKEKRRDSLVARDLRRRGLIYILLVSHQPIRSLRRCSNLNRESGLVKMSAQLSLVCTLITQTVPLRTWLQK